MSAMLKNHSLFFRPMLEQDLMEILEIETQAYEFPWSATIFRDCLQVGYCCWVGESAAGLINAYGVMSVAAGECHILNLCVRQQLQGSGYGGQLLDFLLDLASKHKVDTAFLEVRPSNETARNLYNKAGFNEVGMRRNYYPARQGREDAIIMAKAIIPI
jgi:ribosomal-protein-alanine N-acetyltransferase